MKGVGLNMGKGRPRHNHNKRANQRGSWCSHCEDINGLLTCTYNGTRGTTICKGNPHNCMKVALRELASLNDTQKDHGVIPRGMLINDKGNLYNPM